MMQSRPYYHVYLAEPFERAVLERFERRELPAGLLPLDGLRALTREAPRDTGIYFMWRDAQLLYIGSSMLDLGIRVQMHRSAQLGIRHGHRRYPFTHFTFIQHGLRGLQDLEYRYIQAYEPPFNNRSDNTGFDRRVPVTRGEYAHTARDQP